MSAQETKTQTRSKEFLGGYGVDMVVRTDLVIAYFDDLIKTCKLVAGWKPELGPPSRAAQAKTAEILLEEAKKFLLESIPQN